MGLFVTPDAVSGTAVGVLESGMKRYGGPCDRQCPCIRPK